MQMNAKNASEIMYEVADFYAEDNAHMDDIRETIRADVDDLTSIAKELAMGRVDVAKKQVYMLDTLVRDYVPKNVYDWLMSRREE
jgi:hypothetical protein